MNKSDKSIIKTLFQEKRIQLGMSQEAAAIAAGTKGTTVSQVFSGKYGANNDGIYRILARWVGFDERQLKLAATENYKFITGVLDDAAVNAKTYAIISPAGSGKTYTQHHYAKTHRNAFHLKCNEYWSKRDFMRELLTQMGKASEGLRMNDMMRVAISQILQMEQPLIMIDEADKLKNDVLMLFISLYNDLENHCGLTMSATEHLVKKLKRGVALKRRGYEELWSRLGCRPLLCDPTTDRDVKAICQANGITEQEDIVNIIDDCQGDLRRVEKLIHREAIKAAA